MKIPRYKIQNKKNKDSFDVVATNDRQVSGFKDFLLLLLNTDAECKRKTKTVETGGWGEVAYWDLGHLWPRRED